MGSVMTKEMEAELFRTVEEGKKAARTLLTSLENAEILLQSYTKEAFKMRGQRDDPR